MVRFYGTPRSLGRVVVPNERDDAPKKKKKLRPQRVDAEFEAGGGYRYYFTIDREGNIVMQPPGGDNFSFAEGVDSSSWALLGVCYDEEHKQLISEGCDERMR